MAAGLYRKPQQLRMCLRINCCLFLSVNVACYIMDVCLKKTLQMLFLTAQLNTHAISVGRKPFVQVMTQL